MRTILVTDDDAHIREVIVYALEKAGMRTLQAQNGKEALHAFAVHKPDMIILDINMPETDGLSVCKEIRKTDETPILFLSSRDDEIDRVVGLEIGADDYVTKPFSPRELVARVQAILKRSQPTPSPASDAPIIKYGTVRAESQNHRIFYQDQELILTATEFALLIGMIKQPNRVFDRNTVMQMSHDPNIFISDRTIDSHIRNIRQKFALVGCETIIETVRGVGYRLGKCV